MANLTIQVHGNARRSSADYDVTDQADDSATRKPNMSMDLNFYFSRSSESSSKMKVSVSGTLWRLCKYTSGSSSSSYDSRTGNYGNSRYGYHFDIYFGVGTSKDRILGGWKHIISKDASASYWTEDGYGVRVADYEVDWGSNNNINVYLSMDGGCHIKAENWCGEGDYVALIDSFSVPSYNPYTPPSYSINSISPTYGRYNDTDFTVNYSITGGTGNIDWVRARIYDMGGNYKGQYDLATGGNVPKGNNKTGKFKITVGGTGWHYKAAIRLYDHKQELETAANTRKDLYTYVMPYVSNLRLSANNLTGTKFSPQDNAKVLYTTNARKWTSGENDFTTKCKIGNSAETNASSQEPTNNQNEQDKSKDNIEESLNADVINNKFTANERSVAVMNGSITISRVNTSANSDNYKKGQTLNFQVQFKPTNAPSGGNVTDTSGNSVKNTTIFTNTIGTINVDWAYSHNTGAAGVVNGYKIEIFKSNSYTDANRIGTYYQTGTTKSLNTKTQLKRGVMNYIRITPYYFKPNQTGSVTDDSKIILGALSYTGPLVKPISKLDPPTIEYPVNNSTWHNRYFRVLAKLPVDADDDDLVADGTISSKDQYKYKNIEIKVTPAGKSSVVYTNLLYPSIYNKAVANIQYTDAGRKIAICPALQSLDDSVSSYDVYVRVQKLYYNLTDEESWSDYTKITVKKEAISNLLLEVGDEIKQAHYATVRNKSVDLYNVYPIDPNGLVGNVKRDVGEKIYYKDYKAIYDTILSIRTGVNSYCVYDNIDVSFKRVINDLTNNPPKQEYITAAKTSTSPNGRNYMNILIDDMNLLY